jgi:hypothetical protein
MNKLFLGHTMAAGEPALLPIADARIALAGTQKACTDLAGVLADGPMKVKFLEAATSFGTILAGLPKEDAKPESIEAGKLVTDLLGSLTSANAVILKAQETIGSLRAGMEGDMAASLQRHVMGEIAAGRLHTHTDHMAAIDAARTEAHATCVDAVRGCRARMSMCASANLPIPDDSILNLEDAKFNPLKDEAAARCKILEPLGVKGDQLRTLAWNADKTTYETVVDIGKRGKVTPPNPFENSRANPSGRTEGNRATAVASFC